MNAIGDYIHLRQDNYIKYGTSRHQSMGTYLEKRSTIVNNLFKNKIKTKQGDFYKSLEQYLNVMAKENLKNSYVSIAEQKVVKKWKEYLTGEGALSFGENFTVKDLENKTNLKIRKISLNRGNVISEEKTLKDIVKKIEIIEKVAQEETELGKAISADKALQALEGTYKNLISRMKKMVSGKLPWQEISNLHPTDLKSDKVTLAGLRTTVNTILEKYFSSPPSVLIEGDLFEIFLEQALSEGKILGDQMIEDVHSLILNKNFTPNADLAANLSSEKALSIVKDSKCSITLKRDRSHRSKVDIVAKWKGEDIKISAKNVATSTWGGHHISLVSGSPMDIMLGGVNEDFINHYLNLFAERKGDKKNLSEEQSAVFYDMKLVLVRQAMSGAVYENSQDVADTFIINDKTSGRIRVFSVSQLMDKLFPSPTGIDGSLRQSPIIEKASVNYNGNNLREMSFQNAFQEQGVNARINSILQQLHAAKISVAIGIRLSDF